jgi:hypothetical protein
VHEGTGTRYLLKKEGKQSVISESKAGQTLSKPVACKQLLSEDDSLLGYCAM